MSLLILSFVAGVLTVAAPCILPLLPIIIGSNLVGQKKQPWFKPIVIVSSLAVSVVVFSLLLKASTSLLGIPQTVWNSISGIIVILFGLNLLFPVAWEKFMAKSGFYLFSNKLLGKASNRQGVLKDILIGAALGPVFSSCSPTYALIIAAILPQSFGVGLAYLSAYAIGLALVLLLIAILGQAVTKRLGWLNKSGLQRLLGILFIIVGLAVLFGLDRAFQAFVLEQGWYDPIMQLEKTFMQ